MNSPHLTSRKIVLLGPYPPPYGGVAIFTSALFEFTKGEGVELWAAGDDVPQSPNVSPINYRRLGLIPLVIKKGFKARILDSFYFLIEYPNPVMVPLWALLKLVLRFEWVKVVHDGSLPSRYSSFGFIRKLLFRLSVSLVDEFVVVNDGINEFLSNEIDVRQNVRTVNALLPLPEGETGAALSSELEPVLAQYDRRVISTGVFIPSYGFAHAAEAVERIRRETGENVGLILIDGLFARDDDYRAEVLQGRDWITVLENVPHPQVIQIFRRSDVFLRGFRHEGYGLSRIEAVWCGIPVIAAMGKESRGMLLYNFGDLDALVAHLRKALFDSSATDIEQWSAVFQREAEENLERWKRIMKLA
jgi:glycosyltransferase involved in cell wall biosynthesis